MTGNFSTKKRVFNKKEVYAINLKSEILMNLSSKSYINVAINLPYYRRKSPSKFQFIS